ncbi:MAG: ATP-binding cassette domain-containing protein [Actinobacteria bacterium]|nr:ATP-binding cassette domain-containing protein [Actinomycetota bacterium]
MTPNRSGRPSRAHDRGRGSILQLADVTVQFGVVRALDSVSLHVPRRGFVGLIGPNGAGKTTLFNVVSGFVHPDRGRVRLAGRRINAWPPDRRARAGLGRTFQNVGLDKLATVDENLRIAQDVGWLGEELVGLLTPTARHSEARDREERLGVIELLELTDLLGASVRDLPTGTAKLVELGCVLLRRPRLLLLDEPSSGVGPEETAQLGQALRTIHAERDLAILLIEHDMGLAMNVVDHLYVLNFGTVLAEGPPEAIRNDERVIESYLGTTATEASQ